MTLKQKKLFFWHKRPKLGLIRPSDTEFDTYFVIPPQPWNKQTDPESSLPTQMTFKKKVEILQNLT